MMNLMRMLFTTLIQTESIPLPISVARHRTDPAARASARERGSVKVVQVSQLTNSRSVRELRKRLL